MRFTAFASLFLFVLTLSSSADAQSLRPGDLRLFEGGKWSGELTYRDYSSGKITSIRCEIKVRKLSNRSWKFLYLYPDEPKADRSAVAVLSVDGKDFAGELVSERSKIPGGLRFVTTKRGSDNDRPALFRYTYTLTRESFSVIKEVKIDGENGYFERNRYVLSRGATPVRDR